MSEEQRFASWAILELMGHRRLAGFVEDVEMFGGRLCRLDVYEGDADEPTATQFYGPSAVYCVTPTTPEVARAFAARQGTPRPVARYELEPPPAPRRLPIEDAVVVTSDSKCECGHLRSEHLVEGGDGDGELGGTRHYGHCDAVDANGAECDCSLFTDSIPF